jgi:hypothetical protein
MTANKSNEKYYNACVDVSKVLARDESEGKNTIFVGVFEHPNHENLAITVFYTNNPDTEKGHKHYYGYFVQGDKLFVTDASFVNGLKISGGVGVDGQFYYSTTRHDYRTFGDGLFVDGGQSYLRTNCNKTRTYQILDGMWHLMQEVHNLQEAVV